MGLADAGPEKRQRVLVGADGAERFEDLRPVGVEGGETERGRVDGVAAGCGGLAFGGRQQNQHRTILPAAGERPSAGRHARWAAWDRGEGAGRPPGCLGRRQGRPNVLLAPVPGVVQAHEV